MLLRDIISELWSKKYKKSIDCNNPKGFSQRAHCAGRKARQAGHKTKSKSINENPVTDLEKDLKDPTGYNAIDDMMQSIAKKYNISASQLHKEFVKKHGVVPDDWIAENFADGKNPMPRKQHMRFRELIEAPLADYEPLGDFSQPGPFRGPDKKLVPHAVNKAKTVKFFEKTPYDFRLFFSNISGTGRYSEYGPMSPEMIKSVFPSDSDDILQGHEDAITVVFVGNKGDAKRMLTPWVMAHRFGHAIQAGRRRSGSGEAWKEAEAHFFNSINEILTDFYSIPVQKAGFLASGSSPQAYNALFNAIGTQRSSREGEIRRPYEFLYEIFAQYLGSGRIKFNALPLQINYGRQAWGRATQSLLIRNKELQSEKIRQQTTDTLSRDMEIMFGDVLSESVGKIYIM